MYRKTGRHLYTTSNPPIEADSGAEKQTRKACTEKRAAVYTQKRHGERGVFGARRGHGAAKQGADGLRKTTGM